MCNPWETDAELRRRLEIAERAEATLLLGSTLAHDANNLLTSMMATASMLLRNPSKEVAEHATVIMDCCTQLACMIHRLQQRRGPPDATNVNGLLTALLPTLRSLAGRRVCVTLRLKESLPPVWMDPSDLERIALNLVANARDALPGGGSVLLSTLSAHATLDGEAPSSDWVILEVRDNGSGMDEATRTRACEPFFTTKPGDRGTGLGLSSVATAARAAGGRVHIESEVGEGTTVQVWLPSSAAWERDQMVLMTMDRR